MHRDIFEMIVINNQKQELQQVLSCNEKTKKFGLNLTTQDAQRLMACRRDTLKIQKRLELGGGILPKLIETFCDSQYINQTEYVDILEELQEIFYLYKNESEDKLTDDELMEFMKEQFEGICYGSLEYLSETCLERFSRAIRAGYCGYINGDKKDEYDKFSEEERWDKELYLLSLQELID